MTWDWAVKDLLRHPARTVLSLLGVAVATALLLDMVMLSGGIERSFARLLASRGFELRVSPQGTLPFDTDAMLDHLGQLTHTLAADPGVAAVGPVLGASLFAKRDASLVPVVVYGVNPTVQGMYEVERGADLDRTDTTGVLLGAPSARRLRLAVGDTVRLTGDLDPQVAAGLRDRVVTVRGIARFTYDAADQPSIAVPLSVAQYLVGPRADDRASFLMIRVKPQAVPEVVAARLSAAVPEVSVRSIADMVAQFRLRLSYFRQMSLILGSIALIVTVLLVGTLLAITVNEQIADIAALRAIGIARRTVVRQILAAGFLLTVFGGVAGVGLGLVTAHWLDRILTSFPGLPAAISFFVPDARQLIIAGVILIVTGVAAGIWPAVRAAHAPIATTLRSEAP
ncbi:MAG TPA: ABC transporter permease [Gemmatimonadales bacterium]|jgi:putative ABC transport system permease protein